MTYLITGAAGFIGSHICEELLKEKSNRVIGIDNFYSGKQSNVDLLTGISDQFSFFEIDIRDQDKICELLKEFNVKYVFHQAAIASVQTSVENPILTNDVNVAGSLSILEASRKNGVKRIVFASSAAVYGDEPTLPKNEKSPVQPISPYGLEKLIVEKYMELYSNQYGIECIALRYFNIYGPRQDPKSEYSGVISIFKDKVSKGEPITIYGDGEQYRDFVYVKDLAVVNVKVMRQRLTDNKFEKICVGTGVKTTLNQLIDLFTVKNNHESIDVQYATARNGDIKSSVCDNSILIKLIDFQSFESILSAL